ncbi:MAG: hypothetical protein HC896_03090 [Bacteroidales bacterium]|nr:hypothetical protein [Bacteroidales bacterium]
MKSLKKDAEALLSKAVPFMEKALEINPDDIGALETLKTLYYRLKMEDKHNEIQERLDKLKG